MTPLGWAAHAAIFLALVVNLWFGGDLIEAWLGNTGLGHAVRVGFELVLIGAWLLPVARLREQFLLMRSSALTGGGGSAIIAFAPSSRCSSACAVYHKI